MHGCMYTTTSECEWANINKTEAHCLIFWSQSTLLSGFSKLRAVCTQIGKFVTRHFETKKIVQNWQWTFGFGIPSNQNLLNRPSHANFVIFLPAYN